MQKTHIIALANTIKKGQQRDEDNILASDGKYTLSIDKVPQSDAESSNGSTISFNWYFSQCV